MLEDDWKGEIEMIEEVREEQITNDQSIFSGSEFRPLDPRVVKLWLVTDLIGYGFLLSIMLISLLVWTLVQPHLSMWLIAGWFALAGVCLWYSLWRPSRAYRAWGYRIDKQVLETRSGIIFQRTRLLPLSRLQHVDLERGPFERMYGLSSLVLHTAGTHSANLRIPGLDAQEAVRLRDRLVEIGGEDAV